MLHPSILIRDNWTKTWRKERSKGMVLVRNEHRVARRGSMATDAYIIINPYFPNKELCAMQMMVRLIEEGL